MQTAIAFQASAADTVALVRPIVPEASPRPKTPGRRVLKGWARTWEMIGVIALMSSSAIYSFSQLMTLAR